MMGSFRRPRFMSSPVLSDLARFSTSPSLQLSNTSVWNSVQSAVIKVFQGGSLQENELFTLNQSIRWLLKTEMGSFITDYYQNQLLTRGLSEVLDQILLHTGKEQLHILAESWQKFFTEILPTLQAIFYPVQGQELTVRQMSLLAFRDLVLLKLPLLDALRTAPSIHPNVTQMLLVLQGIHECGGPSLEYFRLERLVETVVSPFICNVLQERDQILLGSTNSLFTDHPEITLTQHLNTHTHSHTHAHAHTHAHTHMNTHMNTHSASDSSILSPLMEQEGEMYMERAGRRHTVANVVHTSGGGGALDVMRSGALGKEESGKFSNQQEILETPIMC